MSLDSIAQTVASGLILVEAMVARGGSGGLVCPLGKRVAVRLTLLTGIPF